MLTRKELEAIASIILEYIGCTTYTAKAREKLSSVVGEDFSEISRHEILSTIISKSEDVPYVVNGNTVFLKFMNGLLPIDIGVRIPGMKFMREVVKLNIENYVDATALPVSKVFSYGLEDNILKAVGKQGVRLIRLKERKGSYHYPYDNYPSNKSGLVNNGMWVNDAMSKAIFRQKYGDMSIQYLDKELILPSIKHCHDALKVYDTYAHFTTDTYKQDIVEVLDTLGYHCLTSDSRESVLKPVIDFIEDAYSSSKPYLLNGKVYRNKLPYLPDTIETVDGMLGIKDIGDSLSVFLKDAAKARVAEYRWDQTRRAMYYAAKVRPNLPKYADDIPDFEKDCITLWLLTHNFEELNCDLRETINKFSSMCITPYDTPVKAAIFNFLTKVKHQDVVRAKEVIESSVKGCEDFEFSSLNKIVVKEV